MSTGKPRSFIKSKGGGSRTAIIGLGRMGKKHIQAVLNLGFELVGIYDQNQDSLEIVAQEYKIPPSYQFRNAKILFEKSNPDCVIVATTAPSHCEYACLAAEAGAKYVLCEKPMAISLKECNTMIETCKKHGTTLAINHQMRFMELYAEPKRILNSPEFGGLDSITIVAGNFGLAMNGIHYFEMFRFMTEEEPYEVTAWFSAEKVPSPRGIEFEDRAGSVRVITRNGKRLYIEAGADQGHGVKIIYAGRYGQIIVDELRGTMILSVRENKDRDQPTNRYALASIEIKKEITPTDLIVSTKSVLKALLNRKNFPKGEDGRLAVATLVAAHVSNEKGHIPVCIDGNLSMDRIFAWA